MVVQGTLALDSNAVGAYGWVTGGSNDAWDVMWSNGAFTVALANSNIVELTQPFVLNGLLRRRVIANNRPMNPDMAGLVLLESAAHVLVIQSRLGILAATASNVREL
jgi:hypothetical protein